MSTARRATCTCQAADPPRLGPRRPLLAASSPPGQDGSTGHRGHRRGRAGAPTLHSVSPAALLSPHQRPARCSATWRRETGTSAQVLCRRGRRWLALLGPGTQCLPADGPGLPWVPEPRGQAGSAPCTSAPGEPLTRSLQPRCPSSVTPSSAHRAAAMSSRTSPAWWKEPPGGLRVREPAQHPRRQSPETPACTLLTDARPVRGAQTSAVRTARVPPPARRPHVAPDTETPRSAAGGWTGRPAPSEPPDGHRRGSREEAIPPQALKEPEPSWGCCRCF